MTRGQYKIQFKIVNSFLARFARQKKILDFDVPNQSISEFGQYKIQFKIVNNFLASEASQKKILDFDVPNQSISEFGLHYWRQIIFFTVPLSKIIFLSQNQSKEFFSKISQPPPPPNIKWTVPN